MEAVGIKGIGALVDERQALGRQLIKRERTSRCGGQSDTPLRESRTRVPDAGARNCVDNGVCAVFGPAQGGKKERTEGESEREQVCK